jgi:non-ribosomal peptide synthetase component E (peptide arylation enzyme)
MLDGCVSWPEEDVKRYKQAGHWRDLTVGEHLDSWVVRYSDRPALSYHGREISYRQMDGYATRLAYRMVQVGMKTYGRRIPASGVKEFDLQVFSCRGAGAPNAGNPLSSQRPSAARVTLR